LCSSSGDTFFSDDGLFLCFSVLLLTVFKYFFYHLAAYFYFENKPLQLTQAASQMLVTAKTTRQSAAISWRLSAEIANVASEGDFSHMVSSSVLKVDMSCCMIPKTILENDFFILSNFLRESV
jgi:predicted membrane-bound dolichyl-phosphate-mannose-protein mannosyltransferase